MRAAAIRLMPRWLKRSVHSAFGAIGFRVVSAAPSWDFQLSNLRSTWLDRLGCDLAIDVGANTGQFAQTIRTLGYTGDIISFEPQGQAYKALNRALSHDARWKGICCALGGEESELELQIAGNSVSSSLLPMLSSHSDALPESKVVGTTKVPVRRLDEQIKQEIEASHAAFLKIDAQGFEANVLEGATGIFDKVGMVELELSLVPLYADQELLIEMLTRMDRLGFVPIALEHGFADPVQKRVLQVDGLFVASRHLEMA